MESFRVEVLLGQIVRLRNHAENLVHEVLELCCSEWFQNMETSGILNDLVLELCCSEWFQNERALFAVSNMVLELCCSEWFQNYLFLFLVGDMVLELCCSEWFQNSSSPLGAGKQSFRAVLF